MDFLVAALLFPLLLQHSLCSDVKCPNRFCKCNFELQQMTCDSNGNNLTFIPKAPKFVRQLFFDGNYLPNISNKTCTNVSDVVKFLRLSKNNITNVSRNAFKALKHLKLLDLSKNALCITSFDLPNVHKLFLKENKIDDFPDFCTGISAPFLQYLDLSGNKISDISPSNLACLTKLKHMRLSKNPIKTLTNNIFAPLSLLETLIINNVGNVMKHIDPFVFNISSLKILEFRSNKKVFKQSQFQSGEFFRYLPNLEKLNLEETAISSNPKILRKTFSPLRHLRFLMLKNVGWYSPPSRVFGLLPSLIYLSLSSNCINNWNGSEVFANVTSLKFLFLTANKINFINETSFPEPLLRSLKRLDLSENPFSCTCGLLWFRNFMKTSNLSFGNSTKGYTCISPPELKRRRLQDFNPTAKGCEIPRDIRIIIAATVSSVIGITLITVAGVVYRCRWHIRYGIYLLRSKRKEYHQIPNDEEFVYDGFVIYCDDDREWVHGTLLPHLEDAEGLRLCVHYRDFDVGQLIVDNIITNMDVSRKIICVMSNNFTRSKWCKFELLLAHDRVLNKDADALVLVMLSEIDTRHINSSIRALITTTTYAAWTDEEIGQNLFWEQIITSMKRSSYNAAIN